MLKFAAGFSTPEGPKAYKLFLFIWNEIEINIKKINTAEKKTLEGFVTPSLSYGVSSSF